VSTIKDETVKRQAEIHQEANTTLVQAANVGMHQTIIAFHNWVNNGSQEEFGSPESCRHTVCHAILVCCTPMLSAVWVEFITSCGTSKWPLCLLWRLQWSVTKGSSIYPHSKHHMLHKFFLIFSISIALDTCFAGRHHVHSPRHGQQ
jgi:hypothetical protein